MIAVRRCLRAEAGGLVSAKPTSGHEVHFAQKPLCKPMKRPPNLEAVYLEGSSGPRLGVPADDRPGSFGRELAVSPKEHLRKPPEFGSMSHLGALAEWLRSGLQ